MKEKKYDVLIVGGGCAGVAAALETARSGLKTALVEKTIIWGGLATSGLVPIYMPLCDGKGRQVTFGISEELLKASIKYGPGRIPSGWSEGPSPIDELASDELYPQSRMNRRYQTSFAPFAFVLGMDELLVKSGADLWLDSLACTPILKGNAVIGVEVENKSGRIAIKARQIIDASGEADIAFRAGAPCRDLGSFPGMLYYSVSLKGAEKALEKRDAGKMVKWEGVGANEHSKGYNGPSGKFSGVDGKQVSQYIMESRELSRKQVAEKQAKEGDLGREKVFPVSLPTMHQIRMSRCIEGVESVLTDNQNKRMGTSIGMVADCRKTDAVWEIPYGSLVPQRIENLLAVGRCMDAEGYAWQVTRLIQGSALTGQIAGIVAELAMQKKTSPGKLDPANVQEQVKGKGIKLHL
jgi:hypothetical protein